MWVLLYWQTMTIPSFEVEVKIAIRNPKKISQKLSQLCAVRTNTETQVDTYFNHPCRNFESTDEALRLRAREEVSVHKTSEHIPTTQLELTYKGPKIDKTTKTRYEMSVSVDDFEAAKSILLQLGFEEVATVKKKREFFSVDNMVVSIDLVEHVGVFLEVEQIVSAEEEIPASRERIMQLLESLGLDRNDSIRESYLELFLRKEHG
jgi:adenylate cyclase class 2